MSEPRPPQRRVDIAGPRIQLSFDADRWNLNHAPLTVQQAVSLRALLTEALEEFAHRFPAERALAGFGGTE